MRAAQHLEHGLCFFHRIHAYPVVMSTNSSWDIDSVLWKTMLCMLSYELNKIWRMVFASIGRALRPPDVIEVMKVIQQLKLRLR